MEEPIEAQNRIDVPIVVEALEHIEEQDRIIGSASIYLFFTVLHVTCRICLDRDSFVLI